MPENSTRRSGPTTSRNGAAGRRPRPRSRGRLRRASHRRAARRRRPAPRCRSGSSRPGTAGTRPPARTRPDRRAGAAGCRPAASAAAAAGRRWRRTAPGCGRSGSGRAAGRRTRTPRGPYSSAMSLAARPGRAADRWRCRGRSAGPGPTWTAPARSRRPRAAPRRTCAPPDRAEEDRLERRRHCSSVMLAAVPARRPADRDRARRRAGRTAPARRRPAARGAPGRPGRRSTPTACSRRPAAATAVGDALRRRAPRRPPGAVGDQGLGGGETQPAGGAGQDVDAVGEPRSMPPILPYPVVDDAGGRGRCHGLDGPGRGGQRRGGQRRGRAQQAYPAGDLHGDGAAGAARSPAARRRRGAGPS